MRSYITPLSVLAVMLAAVLGLVWIMAVRHYDHFPFAYIVGIYSVPAFLVGAVILRFLPLADEWKIGIQVAIVLAPLVILARTRDPYKEQVKVMVVPSTYSGNLSIRFVDLEGAYKKQPFDTVYFRFENGKLEVAEDYTSVRVAMETQCLLYDDRLHSGKPVRFYAKGEKLPADTSAMVLLRDTVIFKNGKVEETTYRIGTVGTLR